mmetsp:Transcript_23004/g.35553  ORF Transcript_23004/g.35553 Transcript_23004/m.35553 type:complete len:85 (+) Transcript_23004:251-505(+)
MGLSFKVTTKLCSDFETKLTISSHLETKLNNRRKELKEKMVLERRAKLANAERMIHIATNLESYEKSQETVYAICDRRAKTQDY